MIYTLEQTSFSMPSPYGKGKMYDNWLVCRVIGCAYKEAPGTQELPVTVSFKASGYRWGRQMIRNDMSWDGQGVFAERFQVSGQGLSILAPDSITYEIIFERGDLHDEVSWTVDLGAVE